MVSNIIYFPSYMGCYPSHWRTPSFFRWVGIPPTSYDRLSGNQNQTSFAGRKIWMTWWFQQDTSRQCPARSFTRLYWLYYEERNKGIPGMAIYSIFQAYCYSHFIVCQWLYLEIWLKHWIANIYFLIKGWQSSSPATYKARFINYSNV